MITAIEIHNKVLKNLQETWIKLENNQQIIKDL